VSVSAVAAAWATPLTIPGGLDEFFKCHSAVLTLSDNHIIENNSAGAELEDLCPQNEAVAARCFFSARSTHIICMASDVKAD
jgi:hypothetical protein